MVNKEFEDTEERAINFFEEEWDNLIILDACRADYYKDLRPEAGKVASLGSHSREFIEKTFSEGDFSDVVYISSNAHFSDRKFQKATGRGMEEVFHTVYKTYEGDPDNKKFYAADLVARDARSAEKLFPGKKKVIHFMQPHYPYLGSEKEIKFDYQDMWKGSIKQKEIQKAYTESLEFVLEYVDELVEDLSGKTIVTADHGELLGEKGLYRHLYGVNCAELREVPWHIIQD